MNHQAIIRLGLTVLFSLGVVLCNTHGDIPSTVFFASYGGVGAYLAARRPSNPIGWLLLATGWGLALGSVRVLASPEALAAGTVDDLAMLGAWANGSGWGLSFIGFMGLALTFPDGKMPTGRWRRPTQAAYAAMPVLWLLIAFNPILNVTSVGSAFGIDMPNPLALAPDLAVWRVAPGPSTLYPIMFVPFLISIASLVGRARTAAGIARLQYRWFVAGIAMVAITTAIWAIALVFFADAIDPAWLLVVVTYPSVPLAVAVAVLRYRLFAIDRIISRSVSWALVTGVLVAVFGALVVGLQTLLSDVTQGETLAVAISTLAAFAVFQPVRRRIQVVVDRRFDRARYDQQRTIDSFAGRIRDEVDLTTLRHDLVATTGDAVRPVVAGVWLRPSPDASR